MNRLVAGAIGGFAATAPMTVVMLVLRRELEQGRDGPEPPLEITAVLAHKAGEGDEIGTAGHVGVTGVAHFA